VVKKYSNIRGTSDLFGSESVLFREINNKARLMLDEFGYEELILPLLEEKDLFIRSVGQNTDIVERQMFKIEDKDIVLRPEGTAQVIRYYLQNSLYKKSDFYKFYYIGSMFRGERPQKGRLRQFNHVGAEAIGSNSFYLDAEMISLALRIIDEVGIKDKKLAINTLGCLQDKNKFSDYIKKSLKNSESKLCLDCKRRLKTNPLRVIDCKVAQCKKIVKSLDFSNSHVCGDCNSHFKDLLSLLNNLGIEYDYNPYLVRGLDYYTNTVFEISSSKLGSQDAVGAGGRYNNLIKSLGGPDVAAIGFALGLERVMLCLGDSTKEKNLEVFVAITSKEVKPFGFNILKELRENSIAADFDYCNKSLKGQMRIAQKKGVRFVVIVGEEEIRDERVILKNMLESSQETIEIDKLISTIKSIS